MINKSIQGLRTLTATILFYLAVSVRWISTMLFEASVWLTSDNEKYGVVKYTLDEEEIKRMIQEAEDGN